MKFIKGIIMIIRTWRIKRALKIIQKEQDRIYQIYAEKKIEEI